MPIRVVATIATPPTMLLFSIVCVLFSVLLCGFTHGSYVFVVVSFWYCSIIALFSRISSMSFISLFSICFVLLCLCSSCILSFALCSCSFALCSCSFNFVCYFGFMNCLFLFFLFVFVVGVVSVCSPFVPFLGFFC